MFWLKYNWSFSLYSWPRRRGDNWEKIDWNCLFKMSTFSLFSDWVVFVLGYFRGETPWASCLTFLIKEKIFLNKPFIFWCSFTQPEYKLEVVIISLPCFTLYKVFHLLKLVSVSWLTFLLNQNILLVIDTSINIHSPGPMIAKTIDISL